MSNIPRYGEKVDMPHAKHDQHLCYMENMGYLIKHLPHYKQLIREPKFVCKKCGRAAKSKINLCRPDKL